MDSTPPPFDAELRSVANAWREQKRSTLTADEIAAMRAATNVPMGPSNEDLGGHGAFYVEELNIPGASGAPDISLLICRPSSTAGPKPVVYYLHPGAMVLGSNRLTVDYILEWARELDLTVVSVEYRLAPENPYPAGWTTVSQA
jgi:acetyl esterase/lipase